MILAVPCSTSIVIGYLNQTNFSISLYFEAIGFQANNMVTLKGNLEEMIGLRGVMPNDALHSSPDIL